MKLPSLEHRLSPLVSVSGRYDYSHQNPSFRSGSPLTAVISYNLSPGADSFSAELLQRCRIQPRNLNPSLSFRLSVPGQPGFPCWTAFIQKIWFSETQLSALTSNFCFQQTLQFLSKPVPKSLSAVSRSVSQHPNTLIKIDIFICTLQYIKTSNTG
jgi:hypothetical protein